MILSRYFVCLTVILFVFSQQATARANYQDSLPVTRGAELSLYAEDNETNCLVCHGKLIYTLTDKGESLRPLFRELSKWGIKNILEPRLDEA